jgi:hypothetical protein
MAMPPKAAPITKAKKMASRAVPICIMPSSTLFKTPFLVYFVCGGSWLILLILPNLCQGNWLRLSVLDSCHNRAIVGAITP